MYSFLILGSDLRYLYLKEFLLSKGFDAEISDEYKEGFDYVVAAPNVNSYSNIIDYSNDEEFIYENSVLTSEGAIKEAVEHYRGSIKNSKILIIGYGNIGKVLSKMLVLLNADVTVSARKEADFLFAKNENIKCINTNDIKSINEYDIVFNTVPFLLFNKEQIETQKENGVFIELASKPYCVKEEDRKNINYVLASALPGKYSPLSAAKIIYESILRRLYG